MAEETAKKLEGQIEQYKMKILELESTLNDITDEAKNKEEQLFEYSGKNFSLEQKIEAVKRESYQEL
jgi:predicted  nucleic acid-binding Zn-ribbon protein